MFSFLRGLFLIFFVLGSPASFSKQDQKTDFTFKFYSEPREKNLNLKYIITVPQTIQYSSFLGSDLPRWKMQSGAQIEGVFKSVELATVRIHSSSTKEFYVKVIDLDHKRVVWEGKVSYANDHAKTNVSSLSAVDDQNHYQTVIKTDEKNRVFSFETMEKGVSGKSCH